MMTQRIREYVLILAITLLMTFPLYITAYRISSANIIPLDNYRGMVSAFSQGNLHGFHSPFGYRILTPLLAVPFTKYSPPVFSQLAEKTSPEWIRTTFALCTVSYGFLLLTTVALYAYMRDIAIPLWGNIAALLVFWASPAREIYLYPIVDASAFFFIVMLYWMYEKQRHWWFLGLSLIGITAKETSIIVIGLTLLNHAAAWPERRRPATYYLFLLLPAVLLYILAKLLFSFPGNERQLYIWEYPFRIATLPSLISSLRGFLLNVYPLWPIALALYWFLRNKKRKDEPCTRHFHWVHALVTLELILLGVFLEVEYNIGRIAFFSFPLFISILGVKFANFSKYIQTRN